MTLRDKIVDLVGSGVSDSPDREYRGSFRGLKSVSNRLGNELYFRRKKVGATDCWKKMIEKNDNGIDRICI